MHKGPRIWPLTFLAVVVRVLLDGGGGNITKQNIPSLTRLLFRIWATVAPPNAAHLRSIATSRSDRDLPFRHNDRLLEELKLKSPLAEG
jgi:hypothetical protein